LQSGASNPDSATFTNALVAVSLLTMVILRPPFDLADRPCSRPDFLPSFHDDPRNGSTLVSLNKMLSRGLPPVALHSVQSGIASVGSGARAKAGFGA